MASRLWGTDDTQSARGQQVGLRDVLRRLSVQAMRRAASSVISLSLPPPPLYICNAVIL